MKVAYIGIDLFYPALETLFDLGCEILEVFTCEVDNKTEFNYKVRNFAKAQNIPCQMTRITKADIERLLKKGCEMAVCGGYYFKIPADTNLKIVNIHPSLLPVGRGSWPMAQAILWGHEKSGVTIHKIAEGFDTGDIILLKEFKISDDETHETFMKKANLLVCDMLKTLVSDFEFLYENAKKQSEGEYWAAPKEEDYTIRWDMHFKDADLILRAFYGYECIYLGKDGSLTKIVGGRAVKSINKMDKKYPLLDGFIEV